MVQAHLWLFSHECYQEPSLWLHYEFLLDVLGIEHYLSSLLLWTDAKIVPVDSVNIYNAVGRKLPDESPAYLSSGNQALLSTPYQESKRKCC